MYRSDINLKVKNVISLTCDKWVWLNYGNGLFKLKIILKRDVIYKFTHVMLKVCVKLAALSAERPDGENRTNNHAFRGHLLYH